MDISKRLKEIRRWAENELQECEEIEFKDVGILAEMELYEKLVDAIVGLGF